MSQSQARSDWVDEVVDKYADMVYRIAFTQMKNKSDAEDIFQEVFLKLCKSDKVFETDEYVKAWLIRVTINTCKKTFVSPWKQRRAEMPEKLPEHLIHEDKYEEDSELASIVGLLPEKYRVVIYLFYFEDMSVADIAETLNSTASTVKSQLSRARGILRKKLEGRVDDVR